MELTTTDIKMIENTYDDIVTYKSHDPKRNWTYARERLFGGYSNNYAYWNDSNKWRDAYRLTYSPKTNLIYFDTVTITPEELMNIDKSAYDKFTYILDFARNTPEFEKVFIEQE